MISVCQTTGKTCERWSPAELTSISLRLAKVLLKNEHILGVAITGSLAHLKPLCHDVDFAILHDGKLPDGGSSIPERSEHYATLFPDDVKLIDTLGIFVFAPLSLDRESVPLNLIFTRADALWDCKYLQSLTRIERFNSFFRRVFTDIPLLLLAPELARGNLQKFIAGQDLPVEQFPSSDLLYNTGVIRISHRCDSSGCKPDQTWEECKAEIRTRKNHHWHD